jgi:hypothetical protein
MVSTTVVFGRRSATFTGMNCPDRASRPILRATMRITSFPGPLPGLPVRLRLWDRGDSVTRNAKYIAAKRNSSESLALRVAGNPPAHRHAFWLWCVMAEL